jgi:hypothetical protein
VVGQRVFAIALGYEDLVDHDEPRDESAARRGNLNEDRIIATEKEVDEEIDEVIVARGTTRA